MIFVAIVSHTVDHADLYLELRRSLLSVRQLSRRFHRCVVAHFGNPFELVDILDPLLHDLLCHVH